MISVIITACNEGEEVAKTIASVRENTTDYEVILVDDGSEDGSCEGADADKTHRFETRTGVAPSRMAGVELAAGDVFCFLDAHQRIEPGAINETAQMALELNGIVYPDTCGFDHGPAGRRSGHGAVMIENRDRESKKCGLIHYDWRGRPPRDGLSRCTTMVTPGYCIPRDIFPKIQWHDGLRGWGASEPAICTKAFFTDTPIFHVCGPRIWHKDRVRHKVMPYGGAWKHVMRNRALIARVCFSDFTWRNYWWGIFSRWGWSIAEYDTPAIVAQHEAFQQIKVRPDRDFWLGWLKDHTRVPEGVGEG